MITAVIIVILFAGQTRGTEAIGKEFGGRDHSTVVYAIQQIEEKSARDPVTKATVSDIIKNIRDR